MASFSASVYFRAAAHFLSSSFHGVIVLAIFCIFAGPPLPWTCVGNREGQWRFEIDHEKIQNEWKWNGAPFDAWCVHRPRRCARIEARNRVCLIMPLAPNAKEESRKVISPFQFLSWRKELLPSSKRRHNSSNLSFFCLENGVPFFM